MGGRAQRSARPDAPQFADLTLPLDVFADGSYTRHRVLEKYAGSDILLFIVRSQLRVALCTHCSI